MRWRIDNFGGAIHFAGNNTGLIENCTFINNFADTNTTPDGTTDPFVSYGGAIDFEDSANITISNCTFRGNSATIGGAVHGTWSNPVISDCDFWSNWAYHGAGALFVGGTIQIERSDFSGNTAVLAAAQGGGICSLGANGRIVDCNVSNNSAAGSGGGIYVSSKDVFEETVSTEGPVVIKNCLITDNTAGRDGGGISANWYSEPNIINCTIANNTVTGIGFGNNYGGGLYSAYGNYSNVLNSILWGNSASNGTQIGIGNGAGNDPGSTVSVSYSDVQGEQAYVFFDENCTLEWGAGNIYTDPLFVTGPLGDYYLSQIAAGQPVDSNCVDTGNDLAIDVGLHQYTTRTDEVFDTNMVDMGYHYPLAHPIESCGLSDLSSDGIVSFADFVIFALYWLDEDCSAGNDWCDGADFTFDSYVNFNDLFFLYGCWLVEDTSPPLPNPSRWEVEPYSASITPPYEVNMTVEAAFDGWGGVVEYYFECVTGNGSDRDWGRGDPNRTHRDQNLDPDTVYGYKVKARDERGNETLWSVIRYALTGEEPPPPEDHNPPTPNPMTWAIEPYATSPTSIAMVATTATDDTAGVEYYFENFNSPAVNSGWIGAPTWTDVGLTPETTYGYRVKARDTSAWQNETGWSDPCSATTPAVPPPPDTTPPTPDPSQWAVGGEPTQYLSGGYYWHTMTAEPASDR
jgi:predicted outer membrane repeat protein